MTQFFRGMVGAVVLLLACSGAALAAESVADAERAIRAELQASNSPLRVKDVAASELSGFYRVELHNGPVVYASADGKHFFLGDLFQVDQGRVSNLSEQAREVERVALLSKVPAEEMIVYAPKGEVKGHLTVFTDVDCYYCQKLHQEIPTLNELGIELRYLAYPRAGIGSPSYEKIASAWCAKDRHAAMDSLKARKPIAKDVCDGNPVASQFTLGRTMGVEGTPALFTDKGQLIPGYRKAEELAELLGVK